MRDMMRCCAVALGLPPPRIALPAAPQTRIPLNPSGGGLDLVARIAGLKMNETLGQAIVVDNRPGAAGMLGAEMAANAPADGYTLLLADSSFTIDAELKRWAQVVKDANIKTE